MANLVKKFKTACKEYTKNWWMDGIEKGAFDALTLGGMLRIVPQRSTLPRKDIDEIQHLMRRRFIEIQAGPAKNDSQLGLTLQPSAQPAAIAQHGHHYIPSEERRNGCQSEAYYYRKIDIHRTGGVQGGKTIDTPWKDDYQMFSAILTTRGTTAEEKEQLVNHAEKVHGLRSDVILKKAPAIYALLPNTFKDRPPPAPITVTTSDRTPVKPDLAQFVKDAGDRCTKLWSNRPDIPTHYRALVIAAAILELALEQHIGLASASESANIMAETLKPHLRTNPFENKD